MPRKTVVREELVKKRLMTTGETIPNPTEYDRKEPTNVRLEGYLKERLQKDAAECGLSLSDLINEAIREKYRTEDEED